MSTPQQPNSDQPRDNSHLRVGDKERNHVLELLSAHFADGYIDIQEFDERTGKAATARTRGDLDVLLADLPSGSSLAPMPNLDPNYEPKVDNNPYSPHRQAVAKGATDRELEELVRRGRRVQQIDSAIWSVSMVLFFLCMFLTNWSYFWVIPVIAVGGSIATRSFYQLDDDEEEIFEEINEKEQSERAKRLRQAAKRRRELE